MAAQQAPPSLGFSRLEHRSGLSLIFLGTLKWKLAKPMLYPVPNDNTGHAPKFWNPIHLSWNSNIIYVFLGYEMGFIWLTTFQVWRNMFAFKGQIYFPYNWWGTAIINETVKHSTYRKHSTINIPTVPQSSSYCGIWHYKSTFELCKNSSSLILSSFFSHILSLKVKIKSLSLVWLFTTLWTVACQAPLGIHKNTGGGCHFLLQGIFPTQRSNSGLPHCRQFTVWDTRESHTEDLISTDHCVRSWNKYKNAWCLHSWLVFYKHKSLSDPGLETSLWWIVDLEGLERNTSDGLLRNLHFLNLAKPLNSRISLNPFSVCYFRTRLYLLGLAIYIEGGSKDSPQIWWLFTLLLPLPSLVPFSRPL